MMSLSNDMPFHFSKNSNVNLAILFRLEYIYISKDCIILQHGLKLLSSDMSFNLYVCVCFMNKKLVVKVNK